MEGTHERARLRHLAAAIVGSAAAPPADEAAATIDLARRHRVHLALADRLFEDPLHGGWPDDRLAALTALTGASLLVEAVVHAESVAVLCALHARGLRPIVFKGGALAHTIYRRPHLRPRTDTDLLIPRSALPVVDQAFAALGYRKPVETSGELVTHQCHFEKAQGPGLLHAWDVHWKISNAQAVADALTFEEIGRDAVPIPSLDSVAAPSTFHALLLACLHRVAHHADAPDLLWLLDIHLLAGRMPHEEWPRFIALARSRAVWAACARSLAQTRDLFRTALPPFVVDAVDEPVDDPSARLLAPGLRQVDVLRADLAALPTWSARWRLIREHAFPPAAFMAARYGVHRPAALPWWYVRRICQGGPKWFRRIRADRSG
jgi:hypothetical protein